MMEESKTDFAEAAGTDAIDAAIELLKTTVFPSKYLGLVFLAVEALEEKRERIKGGQHYERYSGL